VIRCAVNPLLLFLGVWVIALALYLGGVFTGLFPAPHAVTTVALSLNIAAFSLGYLTWTLFKGLPSEQLEFPRANVTSSLSGRMQRGLAFTLLMGVIALVLMFYRVVQIAAHINTGAFALLMNPPLLRYHLIEFLEMSAWQTSPTTMLTSLTSGFFAIGFILLGVFLRLDTTPRRYIYLVAFLVVAFATCMVNLSRYDMTTSIMYLILAYCMTAASVRRERVPKRDGSRLGAQTGRRLIRDLLPPLVGVVIIFVIVELLLHKSAIYHQSGGLRTHIFPFYWNVASSLAAFNDFLGHFHGVPVWGERTFPAFFKWLHRFHLIAPHSFPILYEFIYIPHAVNTYTYLRIFYEDFGLIGVAVVPYVYGVLMAALRGPAQRHFQYLNVYLLLLVPLLFSWFHYCLQSSQFYLQILFGFILFRYELPDREE
jgi:oligosaccharide repeat unit polymerase